MFFQTNILVELDQYDIVYPERGDYLNIEFAFFCDSANIAMGNKLNVMGVFKNINTAKFPCTHPHMFLVVSIDGHRSEVGQHQLKINFVDEDGKNIISPFEGQFEIAENNLSNSFLLEFNGVEFPNSGIYAADITIDNQHKKTVTLALNQV